MDQLQAIFPAASADALTAVLELSGGDVAAATDFLLLPGAIEEVEAGVRAQNQQAVDAGNEAEPEEVEEDEAAADDDDDDGDEEEEDGVEEEGEGEEEDEGPPPPKRLCVEPTPPEKLADRPSTLVQFDQRIFRKANLELLNISLSKVNHTSVTLWTGETRDERAALAMLENPGGYWVHHFPVAEIDHVWRLLVNAHLNSRSTGTVFSLHATSFLCDAGCEVEIRALVRDARELVELKRVGQGLLSVAPQANARGAVFFVTELPKPSSHRESKTRLEEKSTFKLQKEKRTGEKDKQGPFATEYERMVHQLYKVESNSPITWVPVDV